jgi:hypothetical protein
MGEPWWAPWWAPWWEHRQQGLDFWVEPPHHAVPALLVLVWCQHTCKLWSQRSTIFSHLSKKSITGIERGGFDPMISTIPRCMRDEDLVMAVTLLR